METKQRRFGNESDWKRNLAAFSAALDQGVLDCAQNRNTPTGSYAFNQFAAWCRENGLNATSLMHVSAHILDYARALGIDMDIRQLQTKLDTADWHALDQVILSGHPSKLLFCENYEEKRGMKRYVSFSNDGEEKNISPGSAVFHNPPQCCVASEVRDGQGTLQGVVITRQYASGIHPVSAEQIRMLFPQLIDTHQEGLVYDAYSGRPLVKVAFFPAGRDYPQVGSSLEEASREQTIEFFAQRFARGESFDELVCIEDNQGVLSILASLQLRSGAHVVTMPDMEAWYRERLERISGPITLQNISEHTALFTLSLNEYLSEEKRQELEAEYPESVDIPGFGACAVAYHRDASGETNKNITLDMSAFPPERFWDAGNPLLSLRDEDLPMISGRRDVVARVRLSVGDVLVVLHSAEFVRTQIDEKLREAAWSKFSREHERTMGYVGMLGTPPEIPEQPTAYAQDYRGNKLIAYPFRAFVEGNYGEEAVMVRWTTEERSANFLERMFVEKMQSMRGNQQASSRSDDEGEAVPQEVLPQTTLPRDVWDRIHYFGEQDENRGISIMLEKENLEGVLRKLKEDIASAREMTFQEDTLSKELQALKKEMTALDKTIGNLTNRTADKQKQGALRLERRELDDEIDRKVTQLKAARSARARVVELEKRQTLLERQIAELSQMEEAFFAQ